MVAAGDKVDVNLRVEGNEGSGLSNAYPDYQVDSKVLHSFPIKLSIRCHIIYLP